jgi:hypothetical protein
MHADTEIQKHAPGPDNHLAEDDEDPGVKAYRAKRVAKLRKNEAALRLKVAQWWQGVQDVMGPNEAIVSTSQGLVISVIFSVLG